jgi:hypothetical protein
VSRTEEKVVCNWLGGSCGSLLKVSEMSRGSWFGGRLNWQCQKCRDLEPEAKSAPELFKNGGTL